MMGAKKNGFTSNFNCEKPEFQSETQVLDHRAELLFSLCTQFRLRPVLMNFRCLCANRKFFRMFVEVTETAVRFMLFGVGSSGPNF